MCGVWTERSRDKEQKSCAASPKSQPDLITLFAELRRIRDGWPVVRPFWQRIAG